MFPAFRTFPGQVLTTTEVRIFLLEAYTVIYSFTASAFHTDTPSIAEDPLALVKLAIPSIVVLAVLLLRSAAAAGDEERPQLASTIDVSLAFGLVVLAEWALSASFPSLMLPRWRPTQGSWAAWLFLTELRTLFPPHTRLSLQTAPAAAQRMYINEIRWRAEELRRDIRRRNRWACFIATAILALFGVAFSRTATTTGRVGSGMITAAALYTIAQTWRSGASRPEALRDEFELYRDYCRSELIRQRALLRRIRGAYAGLLIPGLLLVLYGSMVYLYVVLMYVLLFAELIYRASFRLEQERQEILFALPC